MIHEKRSSCLINKIRNLTNSLYEAYSWYCYKVAQLHLVPCIRQCKAWLALSIWRIANEMCGQHLDQDRASRLSFGQIIACKAHTCYSNHPKNTKKREGARQRIAEKIVAHGTRIYTGCSRAELARLRLEDEGARMTVWNCSEKARGLFLVLSLHLLMLFLPMYASIL